MKLKNKIVAASVTCCLMFSACTKQVDQNPDYTIDGNKGFTKIEDYEFALTGAYTQFLRNSYYGSSNGANAFVALPDIMSDNLFESSESLANYTEFANWTYTADEALVLDIWTDAYSVVGHANLSLRGLDRFAAANRGAVNRIKAQALAVRALAHFDLLRYFGEEYNRNSGKLGIPYLDTFNVESKPARLTVKATLDRIETDLKTARQLMAAMDKSIQSQTSSAGTARPYIDVPVVDAILARMYNYSGVPDSALKYAGLAINARPLESTSEFLQIWKDATTKGVLWSVKFQAFNSDIGGNVYYAVGNRASFQPMPDLRARYNSSPADLRIPAYFSMIVRRGTPRLVASKYIGREGRTDGIVDFKAFRTAEMHLIRAEAYYLLGQEPAARLELNALRAARNISAGTEAGLSLYNAIFVERQKELFLEGHRFFDLKRTTRFIDVRIPDCTVSPTNNCMRTLLPTDRAWNLPIPQAELDANPAMQGQQNPGY